MDLIRCEFCNCELSEDEAFNFDGTIMCEDCYNDQTCTCDDCGGIIWNEDVEGNDDHTLCSRCYENYTHCEQCGCLIHNDNSYYEYDESDIPYCHYCYNNLDRVIESYSYKPEPTFYGSGSLFLGVELELDKGGENNNNASILLDIANCENSHVYAKHDSSINEGFELVSHPMTLEYHEKTMPWNNVFEKAINMGYRSHQTSTCGLHCHVNRCAFGKTIEEQDDVIARIVYFVEAHWNELLKFSRRTESAVMRWASRYGLKETAQKTYKDAKDKRIGRYVCVNLENYTTIEFRIFRGTLRYETFIATLQLVDEICNNAIRLNDKEFERMTWNEFVANIKDKSDLINYLKSKRLYVNEPAIEMEDM